jgi:ElaB/YqjD/DUF883 family membrane-anchored ribosome-binding protein
VRRLLAPAVALLLAGCGGENGGTAQEGEKVVSPAAWMAEFCAAGVDWQADLEQNAAALETRVAGAQGLDEIRGELAGYFDRAARLTDDAVARVERAGVPEIDGRDQLVADFTGLIDDMGDLFREAGDEARALETADEARFRTRVAQIARRLERRADEVVGDFTSIAARYDSPELDEAFSENEDCAQFAGEA